MAEHNDIGQKGENLAADFLTRKGLIILEKNWRSGRAEIDIIAQDRRTLVFIEVKTRSSDFFEKPEEAVSTRKRRLMTQAAIQYMHEIGHDWAIRFDIVTVLLRGDDAQIQHLEDAFFPGNLD